MNKIYLFFVLFLGFSIVAIDAQTTLEGTVTDMDSGEPILFGTVALYRGDNLVTGTNTDFDGNYSFNNIDPGTYDIQVSSVGYQTQRQVGVVVLAGRANRLNIELSSGVVMDEIEVVDFVVPLIEQDNTTSGSTITGEQIRSLPIRDVSAVAATTAGLARRDDSDAINIRGSRSDATDYYIDGMRVSGRLIPTSEIDQMQVLTGGIPASFGDVVGGVISLTTRGPSSKFSGGIEAETSQFLDPYGYNLISGNFSGPLVRNPRDTTQTLIGFRFSGQLNVQAEDRPSFTGVYQATPEAVRFMEENPVRYFGSTPLPEVEFARFKDADGQGEIEFRDIRRNQGRRDIDLTGRIDARLSDNVDISLTGTYSDRKNQFTPGGWSMFNYNRNPYQYTDVMRGTFRLRHRLGVQTRGMDPDSEQLRNQVIRNAVYTLQFGYQRRTSLLEDPVHGDNFWRYGYVGEFDIDWIRAVSVTDPADSTGFDPGNGEFIAHTGYTRRLNLARGNDGEIIGDGYFADMDINPILNNYNKGLLDFFNPTQITDFWAYNGARASIFDNSYGLFANVGTVYNTYQKTEGERFTFDARMSFEFLPGGSTRGRHNIELGLYYEERVSRNWTIAPTRLWEIGRARANNHIIDVNRDVIIDTFTIPELYGDFVFNEYENLIIEDAPGQFYRSIRELNGTSIKEYINVDGFHPDDLSLEMFEPFELTDPNLISFSGFAFNGDRLSSGVSFEDFWAEGPDGRREFNVAPFRPNYFAFYIQDRFTYKDIIFRLGLRMDRYDANTKVMRDPLSLYPILTADDFYNINDQLERPGAVGDDYSVYVDGPESTGVVGFRRGDQWYDREGDPVNDANLIFGGGLINPALAVNRQNEGIKTSNFDVNSSFEDYKPQVNWMPRLAFSFPISEDANFFAHYDILVQRPTSNNFASAMQYYYFEDAGRTPTSNPNLRPEKTIDYEVGFQQRLTNSSALKIAAYYKEIRDQIQTRTLLFVASPVGSYRTFDNIDFGTVKGFSFQYDLRRTNNLQMTASYTLQFADGTGSGPTSQEGISSRGANLRTLTPLTFDERHRFVVNLDYRYGSGTRYSGPRWFGTDVFENTGVNIQATAVSGRPYTRRFQPTRFGGDGFAGTINGARLPWNFYLDARIDRSFQFTTSRADSDAPGRTFFLNVYLRVQNVLDTRNVLGVYSFSGSPDDSGWLASSFGQDNIQALRRSRDGIVPAGEEELAFLDQYSAAALQSSFFALPRRVYLGAIFEF